MPDIHALPAEPLHVVLRRTLASPPAEMTAEQLERIKRALAGLRWAIDEELAVLLGAWPTPEVLSELQHADPQCLLWIEVAVLAFWLGQSDQDIDALQPPQEIRALADRLLIRQVEWEASVPALLEAMNDREASNHFNSGLCG